MKIILTGASGMVGEGVLHEALNAPDVEQVLVIGRRSCGTSHPKLNEILVSDFFELEVLNGQLTGFDACFFCLGVSSVGMSEEEYKRLTHDLTLHFARFLNQENPHLTFCYISGLGTDSSEKGRLMWARVKGKTENELSKLSFKGVYHFRPGILEPTHGLQHTLPYYKYVGWLFPVFRLFYSRGISTLAQLGKAMLAVARSGYSSSHIEVKDIKNLSATGV